MRNYKKFKKVPEMTEKVFGNVKREPIFKPVTGQNEPDEIKKAPEPAKHEPVSDADLREIVEAMSAYLDVVHRQISDLKQAMETVLQVIDQHGVQIGEISQDLTMTSGEVVRVSRYLGRQVKACEMAITNVPAYIQQEVARQITGDQPDGAPDAPPEENADSA